MLGDARRDAAMAVALERKRLPRASTCYHRRYHRSLDRGLANSRFVKNPLLQREALVTHNLSRAPAPAASHTSSEPFASRTREDKRKDA